MENRIIILDVDGTLKNISLYGLIISFKEIIKSVEKNPQDFFDDIKSFITSIGYTDNMFIEFFDKHYNNRVHLFPWVKQIIPELSKTNRLTVLTSNKASAATTSFRKANLLSFFEMIIGNEHVKRIKPDPEGIKLIYNKLGGNPSDYIIIGDTSKDVKAGKKAGIKTGLVKWGVAKKRLEKWKDIIALKPDYIFEQPNDLIKMLC
ncbi:HAD family hydrolase [Patescibacteria group bacterium]